MLQKRPVTIPKGASLPALPELEASWRACWLILLFGAMIALSLVRALWLPMLIGLAGWFFLLFCLIQFRLDLRDGFELHPPHGEFLTHEQTFLVGKQKPLLLELRNIQGHLHIAHVRMRHSAYLRSELTEDPGDWRLQPGKTAHLEIELETPVMGKFAIHGAEFQFEDRWRLFRSHRYLPAHCWVRVLPAIPLSRLQRGGRILHSPWRVQSGIPQRQLGTGSDLRDIREYQPGDSRRTIVWKHSLRHRKLLCREFESEVPFTTYLLLDTGQSMREGRLGNRKLDYASEVVTAFAKSALEQRDKVGLLSFDGETLFHNRPAGGKQQLQHILQHISKLHCITKPEFSALPLGELCHLVGEFLYREGMLARQNGKIPADARSVVEYVWDFLLQHPELGFPKGWEAEQELLSLVLRTFCEGAGVELPYRYHQWVTYKAAGLERAIEEAVQQLRGGQLLVILSDLGDILHWDGILPALRMARQRKHHVVFLSPFSPWFAKLDSSPQDPKKKKKKRQRAKDRETTEILQEILTLEHWTWRRRVQRMVGGLGIPVLSIEPKDAPLVLMDRLRRLRLSGSN